MKAAGSLDEHRLAFDLYRRWEGSMFILKTPGKEEL